MRNKYLKKLYDNYPVLKFINDTNNSIINERALFNKVNANEHLTNINGRCDGIFFILSGRFIIYRVNEDGVEVKLYELKSGELCYEALSCILNVNYLNIIATALQDCDVCIIPMDVVENYIILSIKPMNLGVIMGGILFGIGFGLIGVCPGTALGALGGRRNLINLIFVLIGGVAGAFIFAISYGRFKMLGLFDTLNFGKLTLFKISSEYPAIFNMDFRGLLFLGIAFMAAAYFMPLRICKQ